MVSAKVLIEGWINADCKKAGKPITTASTISLVKDGDIIAVIDPGELPDQQMLIEALKNEGLAKEDVTHIFQTHYHVDHTRNTGLFSENVTVINEFGEWRSGADKEMKFPCQYSEHIKIIKTPGHSDDGLTYLVQTTDGLVAICGDVFWKENYPEHDPYAKDLGKLEESRQQVLDLADFVIPGHGNIYEIKND